MKKILHTINQLIIFLVLACLAGPLAAQHDNPPRERVQLALADVSAQSLLPEAHETLRLIEKGGPYLYDRDGIVFGNFEKRLPLKERGYYHEFTVKTPGVRHRGARRIVTGKAGERYYSDDHYKTFKRIVP